MFKKILNIFLIILMAGILNSCALEKEPDISISQPETPPSKLDRKIEIPDIVLSSNEDFDYILESSYEAREERIIRQNKITGESEVVTENILELADLNKDKWSLTKFAAPIGSNKVYFMEVMWLGTEGTGPIWSFDLTTKELKKTENANAVYEMGFGGFALSPNNRFFIQAPDAFKEEGNSKTLKLVDLEKDTVETIVTLTGNETFNGGYGFLSSLFEIEWLDDSIIQYNVYNQAGEKEGNYKPLIETRTVTIE